MPEHPIYNELTGATRVRQNWLGRMIVQVEATRYGGRSRYWRDATIDDLYGLDFQASSSRSRRRERKFGPGGSPPVDWGLDTLPGLAWP